MLSGSDYEVTSDSTDSSDVKKEHKSGYIRRGNNYIKIDVHTGGKEFMKLKEKMKNFGDDEEELKKG